MTMKPQVTPETWFPLFEFQEWTYQSTVLTATPVAAASGTPLSARIWGAGKFECGQAFRDVEGGMAPLGAEAQAPSEGYTLAGRLIFRPGVELAVTVCGRLGIGDAPAHFEATAVANDGPMAGAVSKLIGWAFPELPIRNAAAPVVAIRGAVWVVRGTDATPLTEPGGMPVGTVGSFVIDRTA